MSDYVFKILLVGDKSVGKTSLTSRFLEDRFFLKYHPTVGIDFNVCHVEVAGRRVGLQIWDTAGDERFHALLPNYYRNAHGVMVIYDTTSLSSFRNVDNWLKELGGFCSKGVNFMLVGNKCDELEKRQVTQEKAARYSEHFALSFCETSAKSGANVKVLFETFAVEVYNRLVLGILPSTSTRSMRLASEDGSIKQYQAHKDQGESIVSVLDMNRIRLEDKKSSEEPGRSGHCFI
ncbi:ras-related protein RIC1-like [Drosophila serrata]|uniref:ras-related protein RIC1-like n=1 Tax=Drosophila serrata TaxID=7274 RepID=UPI000A1D2A02|nr:ras-related protein RIC1-like [Drosophila serrata]